MASVYLHSKLYELDFTDSHLSEDEIAEIIQRGEAEALQAKQQGRARNEKRTSFRWGGGMC